MSNEATKALSFVRGTMCLFGSEENPSDYEQRGTALESVRGRTLSLDLEPIAQFGLVLWWETEQNPETLVKFFCSVDQKLGIKAACVCARWAISHFWTDKTDSRPIKAVATTEKYLRGEATLEEVRAAADAAAAAAYAVRNAENAAAYAAAYAADAAAYAAAYAVNAAAYAENAAAYAENAAYAAAYAAYAAAYAVNAAAYAENAAAYAAAYAAAHAAARAAARAARLELCKEIRKAIELPSVRLIWK